MTTLTRPPELQEKWQALAEEATAYARSVVAGETIAGGWVRKACARHLRDLEHGPARGLRFDLAAAGRAIHFMQSVKHYKGEWAGKPLQLEPWQKFIVGSLFGWLRADGTRRFRVAYVEIPRKNGKSLLAAAIGLLLAHFDGEGGAEVYAAATKRDQAKIVWGDARAMVLASPSLKQRIGITGGQTGVGSLYRQDLNSKFQPLGADADSMDGLNVHGAIVDELHAHKTRNLWDVLQTATGARRQPLIVAITTAGFNRHSVCYEQHHYGCQLLDEVFEDDTFFAFIATIDDQPHEELFHSSRAVQYMVKYCTCQPREVASTLSFAQATQIERQWHEAFARAVTTGFYGNATPSTGVGRFNRPSTGQRETASGSTNTIARGSSETPNPSARANESGSTDSPLPDTSVSLLSRVGGVPSAELSQRIWSWITTMHQEWCEDSSAAIATLPSVFSETLRQVCSAHSNTCSVHRANLTGLTLSAHVPGDDWTDPDTWRKANPNYGVSVKVDDLERKCEKAKQLPAEQNAFLRLHLNVWTEQETRWIDMELWDANAGELTHEEMLEALKGRECYAGVDLSSTRDLTAIELIFPDDDGGADILSFPFIPKDNMQQRVERDRVPYDVWVKQGFLEATEGNVIDHQRIRTRLGELAEDYVIREVGYDPFTATQFSLGIQDDGLTAVPVRQGFLTLSEPTKAFERLLLGGKLRHGGHPVLRWAVGNVSVRTDPAGNIKPDKERSPERIDPFAAAVNAMARVIVQPDDGPSVYETRGALWL